MAMFHCIDRAAQGFDIVQILLDLVKLVVSVYIVDRIGHILQVN